MSTSTTTIRPATFGAGLRWWRTNRRFSQLQLANEAGVSSRHLSFLETGKARPSREMVIHLATVLDLPLRDRNALLHDAGFAAAYPHSDLDAPEMDDVRTVLRTILDAHLPNPAVVLDRTGDLVEANRTAYALLAAVVAPDSPALGPTVNLNRIVLHPDGFRPQALNWVEVAANILGRLEREHAHRPADDRLAAIVDEVLTYPGVAELRREPRLPTGADLLVSTRLRCFDGSELSLLSTIATIGSPYDVTLDELHLETFFPGDAATADVLSRWNAS